MGETFGEKFILLGRSKISRVMDSLDMQRRDGRFCDVVLKMNEDSFLAVHASVLSACSSYINDLVSQDSPRKFCEENPQIIELTIVPFENMHYDTLFSNLLQLVEHFYGRNLSINRENCYNIYKLASFFQADDIVQQCEEFISNRVTNEINCESEIVEIEVGMSEVGNKCEDVHNVRTPKKMAFKHIKGQQTLRLRGKAKRFSANTPGRPRSRTGELQEYLDRNAKEDLEQSEEKKCKTPALQNKDNHKEETLIGKGIKRSGVALCSYKIRKNFEEDSDNQDLEDTPNNSNVRTPQQAPRLKHKAKHFSARKPQKPSSKTEQPKDKSYNEESEQEDCEEQTCKKCNFVTKSSIDMRNHELTHYGRPYICRSCGYKVKQLTLMINHLLDSKDCPEHQGDTICSVCEEEMSSNEVLHEHFKLHDHPKPFICSICELRLPHKSGLFLHKQKHVRKRMFICSTCGSTFKTKYSLQNHMIVHETEKNFICDQCGYATKYKAYLAAHYLLHTGETLKCKHPGCSFEAIRTSVLKDHMLKHSKERAFVCEVCGFAFSRATHLRRHSFLHGGTSVPIFSCPICEFTSHRSDKVKDHIKKQHSGYEDTKVTKTIVSSSENVIEDVKYQVISGELELQQDLNTISSVHTNSYIGPVVTNLKYENVKNLVKDHMKKQHTGSEDTKTIVSSSDIVIEDVKCQIISGELELQQDLNTISSVHTNSYIGPVITNLKYENIENLVKDHNMKKQHPGSEDTKITKTMVSSSQTPIEEVQYQVVSGELELQEALNTISSVHTNSYIGPVDTN